MYIAVASFAVVTAVIGLIVSLRLDDVIADEIDKALHEESFADVLERIAEAERMTNTSVDEIGSLQADLESQLSEAFISIIESVQDQTRTVEASLSNIEPQESKAEVLVTEYQRLFDERLDKIESTARDRLINSISSQ